jgi:hypothetical protein
LLSLQRTIIKSIPQTLSYTEMELVMLKETKFWPKKFLSLKLQSISCMKKLKKDQRLLLSLSTNEFPKDFSWRTTKVNYLIHHLVVLLIKDWLKSMDQTVNSLTSSWHHLQQLKDVFCQHISSYQKMILLSQRPKFSILHSLCVISTSIGQDQ